LGFAITFNFALTNHMRAIEFEVQGEHGLATSLFQMARELYILPLRQAQDAAMDLSFLGCREGYIFSAIFSNLAHVHVALGDNENAKNASGQLLQSLFFLSDTGRVATAKQIILFDLFMENAFHQLIESSLPAAAA
jgi:hypothetical protein